MSFLGADTDELRGAADECMQGKEITDQVIQYVVALIALLKAASFFTGGASAAYAQYLESVVLPWLKKISAALELFAKVLGGNADAQDKASQGETVDPGSIPTYTSQVTGTSSAVQPFNGSVLGSGGSQGAAFGAITGAASSMGGSPGTTTTVTSPDGTVTTVTSGGATTTAPATTTPLGTTPVGSTPVGSGSTTGSTTGSSLGTGTLSGDALVPRGSALDSGGRWHTAPLDAGSGGGGGASGGGSLGSGGGGSALGGGSVDGGSALGSGAEARTDAATHGPTTVHSTPGSGGGTPGGEALGQGAGWTGDPVKASGGDGTSYAAAAGLAGGAGALGLGGAALAAKGAGAASGGTDAKIDELAAANGYGSKGRGVTDLQQRLTDAGYDTQGVDGTWGPDTQAAYDRYRADHPLPVQAGSGYSSPTGYDYSQIKGVKDNPRVTPEFLRALEGVAQRTGARPEHLMGVMSLETMGTFKPGIQNPDTKATGLIQFIPSTAKGLGTSTAALAQMTPTEQLTYVEKYLSQPQYRGRVGTLEGLYSAVLPGRIHESGDVIFRGGTEAYRDNKWLDKDGSGDITLREAVDQVKVRMGSAR